MSELQKSLNEVTAWKQGSYAPVRIDPKLPVELIEEYQAQESFLVRPSLRGNAICQAVEPEIANWIAKRLNKCKALETENAKLKQELEAKDKRWQELREFIDEEFEDQRAWWITNKMQEIEGGEND